MTKKITTLNIDDEVMKKAKKRLTNISEFVEAKLRDASGMVEVLIDDEPTECEFCGRPGEKASDILEAALTWLYPDEKWICESCLRSGSLRVPASKA